MALYCLKMQLWWQFLDFVSFCSPLFVLLRELVNASNGDSAPGILKDSVLNLICIFRAIKKAEDAIDVQKTSVRNFSKEFFLFLLCYRIITFMEIGLF